jgi:hypothetical protein
VEGNATVRRFSCFVGTPVRPCGVPRRKKIRVQARKGQKG